MTVSLTYGSLNINDQTNYRLGEGLDLGEPAFENMLSSNIRSSGSRFVATREGDREIKIPLALLGASATGFAANARALWAEMLKDTNTLAVTLPGMASGVTFDTFKAKADVNLSTLLLSGGLKDYDVELSIPAKSWGWSATTPWLGATGITEAPFNLPVTGVSGDTLALARFGLEASGFPAVTGWTGLLGRRANYHADFSGIGVGALSNPVTGTTYFGGSYDRYYATATGWTEIIDSIADLRLDKDEGTYEVFALVRPAVTGGAQFRLRLADSLAQSWYTDAVAYSKTASKFEMLDLGSVTMPPTHVWDDALASGYTVSAYLQVYATATGAIDIDFNLWVPYDGGFMRLATASQTALIVDGISEIPGIYACANHDDTSGSMVVTKPSQRIDLSSSGNNLVFLAYKQGAANADDTVKLDFTCQYKYRSRYLLL